MLDFTELSPDGEDLEQLVRELCLALGYRAVWSGRGADGGRDLLITEPGDPLFGGKQRTWLASCKHTAHANRGAGRAVNGDDVGTDGGISDALAQHGADGYLLVCTTVPSAALVTRLETIDRNKGIPIHVWDGVTLERMLTSPRGWAVAQRFLPVSADASGWRIFATESPNRFVGVTRGFFIRLANRHGSTIPYQLDSVDERLDRAAAIELPEGHELRPRGVFFDDKHGTVTSYFDYLHGPPSWQEPAEKPVYTARELEGMLGDGRAGNDGQIDRIQVSIRPVDAGRDGPSDRDHYAYYVDVPPYV